MTKDDQQRFSDLITAVYQFFRVDVSKGIIAVWWNACSDMDFDAIKAAFGVHARDPDRGQFLPKPADIVRIVNGGSADTALTAWAKLERAIRCIGPYRDVVFDDALIHACIENMGGWVHLCGTSAKEMPFLQNNFATLYRGFRSKGEMPSYVGVMIGEANAYNRQNGHRLAPPVMIGNRNVCAEVAQRGLTGSSVQISKAGDIAEIAKTKLLGSAA